MPSIPLDPYQQRTSAPGPVSFARMDAPPTFGNDALAATLNHVAENVQKIKQRDAAQEYSARHASLLTQTIGDMKDAQNNAADDAADFTPQVLSKFDQRLNDALDTTKSPLAKRMLREQATELRAKVAEKAITFEAETKLASRLMTVDQNVQRLVPAVQLDPDSWKTAGESQILAIEAMQLPPQERAKAREFVHAQLKTAAALGYAERAPLTTLARLKDPKDEFFGLLSLPARERTQAQAHEALVKQQAGMILAQFERGARAGVRALSEIDKTDLPPDLKANVRARVDAGVSQLRGQRQKEYASAIAAIDTAIATDNASSDTLTSVGRLYERGAFTPLEAAHLSAQIEGSMHRRTQDRTSLLEIQDALAAGLPLDPHNTLHRKFLEGAFRGSTQGMPTGSPEWQASAVALANKARMLPESASAWARQALRSPDETLAAKASQFYEAIRAGAPDAVSSFDADTKAFAAQVAGQIQAGAPPKAAVDLARRNTFELDPDLRERREKAFSAGGLTSVAVQSDGALKNLIGDDFGGWFSANPKPTADLAADYGAQVKEYFLRTGDAKLAQQLAWEDIKTKAGVTEVNGFKQFAYAPIERFGLEPQEVRKELEEFLKTNPQAGVTSADELILQPDSLTILQLADLSEGRVLQPSYQVVLPSGDMAIDAHGRRLRYSIPSNEDLTKKFLAAQQKANEDSQRAVEAARAAREWRLQYEQDRFEHPEWFE